MPNNNNTLPNLVVIPQGYAPLNAEGMALANLAAWHLQRIGNSGILAAIPEPGSASPPGSAANPLGTFKRPWIEEPPGSVPFDEQGTIPLADVPAPGVDVPVLVMTVPQGYDGVIKWISNNVLVTTGLNPPPIPGFDLRWKILINGRALRNFGNMMFQKGTPAQGRQISPIRIFSGDIITFTVEQRSGNLMGNDTLCSLSGYFYPAKGVS